jgi:uncharacterized coiled-coil protein SlyX
MEIYMKKWSLLLLATIILTNSAMATNYDPKVQLTAKRQIYKVQIKALNNSLKTTMDEYSKILTDEKMKLSDKQKKMNELEEKIMNFNAKKLELKEQYKQDKREIKEKAKQTL